MIVQFRTAQQGNAVVAGGVQVFRQATYVAVAVASGVVTAVVGAADRPYAVVGTAGVPYAVVDTPGRPRAVVEE